MELSVQHIDNSVEGETSIIDSWQHAKGSLETIFQGINVAEIKGAAGTFLRIKPRSCSTISILTNVINNNPKCNENIEITGLKYKS
jgi:hypothetical protein